MFPIHSWVGFRDDGLGNSSGWLAATVASYCPSRSSQCAEENKQNLAHERMGNLVQPGRIVVNLLPILALLDMILDPYPDPAKNETVTPLLGATQF